MMIATVVIAVMIHCMQTGHGNRRQRCVDSPVDCGCNGRGSGRPPPALTLPGPWPQALAPAWRAAASTSPMGARPPARRGSAPRQRVPRPGSPSPAHPAAARRCASGARVCRRARGRAGLAALQARVQPPLRGAQSHTCQGARASGPLLPARCKRGRRQIEAGPQKQRGRRAPCSQTSLSSASRPTPPSQSRRLHRSRRQ
mmetsp:Transcript_85072/g.235721  ORF Transcript_85072/g.235721 Transcript_85072/m.235721 type:complete len:200 (+) Transcript_85072:3-602(+)